MNVGFKRAGLSVIGTNDLLGIHAAASRVYTVPWKQGVSDGPVDENPSFITAVRHKARMIRAGRKATVTHSNRVNQKSTSVSK